MTAVDDGVIRRLFRDLAGQDAMGAGDPAS
jgi:hypothetical protein